MKLDMVSVMKVREREIGREGTGDRKKVNLKIETTLSALKEKNLEC